MPRGHCTTSSSGEHGQIVAGREDRESFLGRLGLSLAEAARQLPLPTSAIAKAVERAERREVHWVNSVPHYWECSGPSVARSLAKFTF